MSSGPITLSFFGWKASVGEPKAETPFIETRTAVIAGAILFSAAAAIYYTRHHTHTSSYVSEWLSQLEGYDVVPNQK